jgi:hypothetical protein
VRGVPDVLGVLGVLAIVDEVTMRPPPMPAYGRTANRPPASRLTYPASSSDARAARP